MKKSFNILVDFFQEETSYKLVSLLVALALWMTLITRQDIIVEREIPINYLTREDMKMLGDLPPKVQVRLIGSRKGINKFTQENIVLPLDFTESREGGIKSEIRISDFNLPQGVRILNLNPMVVRAKLVEKTK